MENNENQVEIEIIKASSKDMLCSYSYELLSGATRGDIITRKGVHIVHEDLIQAFADLTPFLAHIDGAFNAWATNQTDISDLKESPEFELYSLTGFKIQGAEENRSVILVGNKQTSYGQINFETPKIKLEGNYLYLEAINACLNRATDEVYLYMTGKTAPKPEQTSMAFDGDEDFEAAKVD